MCKFLTVANTKNTMACKAFFKNLYATTVKIRYISI